MTYLLEANDQFGSAVALEGNNLAVGALGDDGLTNGCGDCGAIYLFNFADSTFNGGSYVGTIGHNYTGSKSLSITSTIGGSDNFGTSVSIDGRRLAAGARGDDGFGNVRNNSGTVYLFSFADDSFLSPTFQAQIGYGYTGGKNLDLTSTLDADDLFGDSLSLDGRRLVVGAYQDDGFGNALSNSGAVHMFTFADDLFTGLTKVGTIGSGYIGAGDYNLTTLFTNDFFGLDSEDFLLFSDFLFELLSCLWTARLARESTLH